MRLMYRCGQWAGWPRRLRAPSLHHLALPQQYYTSKALGLYTQSELMGNDSPKKEHHLQPPPEPEGLLLHSVLQKAFEDRFENTSKRNKYQCLLSNSLENTLKDRALGCLFGSFIGDSLGSHCEFSKSISEKLMDYVMTMPGGGVFDLKPGQLTDDSQLSVHLLRGLRRIDTCLPLAQQQHTLIKHISTEYVSWLESHPFDIGITCRKAIGKIRARKNTYQHLSEMDLGPALQRLYAQVGQENKDSESNGSLMRIAPMAVLFSCARLAPPDHEPFIKNQVRLMHPKPVVHAASYLWVNMLVQIIQRTDDTPQTFKAIFEQIQAMDTSKHLEEWFAVARQTERMSGTIKIGWAKIAWSYGMNQLHRLGGSHQSFDQTYYKRVIREIIKEAGDTDTNACIVGGLLGALVGFSRLPPWYIQKMLQLRFDEAELSGTSRPAHYQPFQVLLEALDFIDNFSSHETKLQKKP